MTAPEQPGPDQPPEQPTPETDQPPEQPPDQPAPTREDIARLELALREERKAKLKAEAEAKAARRETMSDQDRLTSEAYERGKAEARAEVGRERAEARFRSIAAGKVADLDEAVEIVGDMGRFVGEDGGIDDEAIGKVVERLAKRAPVEERNGKPPLTTLKPGVREGAAADGNSWLRGKLTQAHRGT